MATARCIWSDWDLSDLWVKGKSTSHVDFKAQNPKLGAIPKKENWWKLGARTHPENPPKTCQSVRLFLRSEDVPGCLRNFGWMHQLRVPLAHGHRSQISSSNSSGSNCPECHCHISPPTRYFQVLRHWNHQKKTQNNSISLVSGDFRGRRTVKTCKSSMTLSENRGTFWSRQVDHQFRRFPWWNNCHLSLKLPSPFSQVQNNHVIPMP